MDHIFHMTNLIIGEYQYHIMCNISYTKYDIIKKAVNAQYPYIFEIVEFSIPIIPFLEIFNVMMTVCYNFVDVFIISLSIAITMRFQQINERLLSIERKVLKAVLLLIVFANFLLFYCNFRK